MSEVNCGEIGASHLGKSVSIRGWCRMIRDHGAKLFIDIADKHGMTQLVFDGEAKAKADSLRREFVIEVTGKVAKREPDTVDKTNKTGDLEISVEKFKIISESLTPPFEIIAQKEKFLADEELRLKYRYLDLRRTAMVKNLAFRDQITKIIRKYFWENDFMELETPSLVKDTYETGSRTFLVPSRVNKGEMYSLAQSPQVYKQLCMMGGIERYFQIARCYRDEDPREDRQPEFTQVDVEMAFTDEKQMQALVEKMLARIFKGALGKELKLPLKHMQYSEAMSRFGSDKPDMRFGMEIRDLTEEFKETDYQIIKRVVSSGGKVKALAFEARFGSAESQINKNYMLKLIEEAKGLGLGGLTWLYVEDGKIVSDPKAIAETIKGAHGAMIKKLGAKEGDVIIMGSDLSEQVLLNALGRLRKMIGDKLGKYNEEYSFLWIEGFPLFEADEVTKKLKPAHNPFSAPTDDTLKYIDSEPEKAMAKQYDIVLNGFEVGGGSIRINDPKLQKKVLAKMGMSDDTIERNFGFLIEALSYGAPVHGGIAIGLDRLITVLGKEENIRDFILFPKNKKQELLIDGAPTQIEKKRLRDDYGISIDESPKAKANP